MSDLLLRRRALLTLEEEEQEGGGIGDGKYVFLPCPIKTRNSSQWYRGGFVSSSDYGSTYRAWTSPSTTYCDYGYGPNYADFRGWYHYNNTTTTSASRGHVITRADGGGNSIWKMTGSLVSLGIMGDYGRCAFIESNDQRLGFFIECTSGSTYAIGFYQSASASNNAPTASIMPINYNVPLALYAYPPQGPYINANKDTLQKIVVSNNAENYYGWNPATASISVDGGWSWINVKNVLAGSSSLPDGQFRASSLSDDGKYCAITYNDHLYISTDGCATFNDYTSYVPTEGAPRTHLMGLNASAKWGTLYLTKFYDKSSSGTGWTGTASLWRSTNKGKSWTKVWTDTDGIANGGSYTPKWSCNASGNLLIMVPCYGGITTAGKVYKSDDYGDTWTHVDSPAAYPFSASAMVLVSRENAYDVKPVSSPYSMSWDDVHKELLKVCTNITKSWTADDSPVSYIHVNFGSISHFTTASARIYITNGGTWFHTEVSSSQIPAGRTTFSKSLWFDMNTNDSGKVYDQPTGVFRTTSSYSGTANQKRVSASADCLLVGLKGIVGDQNVWVSCSGANF